MTTSEAIHSASTGVDGRYGSVGNARTDTTAIPELLGFASHELRSPLSTILASTKLLELSPAASRPELIETITSEAHRMTSIVDNLLTYARLELGHGRDSEPVLLGRTVESTVARIRADHPGAEIRVTAEAGLTVEVDPADIELVVGNYLSNARKYGRGQPIEVEVRRDDRYAVVLVLDRGPGISDEDRDRVFEPFYRVAATAKHEPGSRYRPCAVPTGHRGLRRTCVDEATAGWRLNLRVLAFARRARSRLRVARRGDLGAQDVVIRSRRRNVARWCSGAPDWSRTSAYAQGLQTDPDRRGRQMGSEHR